LAQTVGGTIAAEGRFQPERLILVRNFFEELRQLAP
jgi:hypothetical protein